MRTALAMIILAATTAAAAGAPAKAGQQETVLAALAIAADTPEVEVYRGTAYVWLGRATIWLVIPVAPAPGHVLEFDWGSKNDTREAVVVINGKEVPVKAGGWDGFKPVRVAVPAGVSGEQYEVELRRAASEKATFLSGVRLLATGEAAAAAVGAKPKTMDLEVGPVAPPPETFAEMRPLWDTPTRPAAPCPDAGREASFRRAEANGRRWAEALYRCRRFVDGWLGHADPATGLIPRNLTQSKDIWNAKDSAADNYPFMVLACALTDRPMFDGRMRAMLATERRVTSRLGPLPDTYAFSKQGFATEKINLADILFGSSEYVKDGLLPLTEWLGPSPWCDRMLEILDAMWERAPVDTPHGKIVSTSVEINGEMLQTLARVHFMTGDAKYLDWAVRLGDYYLLGDHHPTRDMTSLRLDDHGCELVSGLTELYAACHFVRPEKARAYREPIHAMLDRVLEIGTNDDGFMVDTINPRDGKVVKQALSDNWGYNYNGFYTVYLVDGIERYRQAVVHVLESLRKPEYLKYAWEGWGSDGIADCVEGALNLYNREPVEGADAWIDANITRMFGIQKADGVIEGWHGDGNFARTAILFALWKSEGCTVRPWRKDVRVGAVRQGERLLVSLAAGEPWEGRLLFDVPRHRVHMKLPMDWPRINQFPEWFTVEAERSYTVRDLAAGAPAAHTGRAMAEGIPVRLEPGRELRLEVAPTP